MIKDAMKTDYYHISLSTDIVGVESAVALKNGYALGIALTIGLNQKAFGLDSELHFNSQAAVFGQSVREMNKLLKLQGAEDYDNEVNAILALYEFATGDLSNVGEDDIPELVDYAIKSDAIYNTLVSISEEEENPFGIEFTNEDDLNYIAEKLDENYEKDIADSANDKERVNGVYKAIATFFGVNDRVNFGK
jgi:hypothetical protein